MESMVSIMMSHVVFQAEVKHKKVQNKDLSKAKNYNAQSSSKISTICSISQLAMVNSHG